MLELLHHCLHPTETSGQKSIYGFPMCLLKSQTSLPSLRVFHELFLEFIFDSTVVSDFTTIAKVMQLLLSIRFLCIPLAGLPGGYKQYCGPLSKYMSLVERSTKQTNKHNITKKAVKCLKTLNHPKANILGGRNYYQ